ncbi:hypothetical protein SUGI_0114130 [Cryptomeria japonica]|nr:hypothetical protein SUGI_0114130 [Cryptomeria japonica]
MTEEKEALFEQLQNKISEHKFRKFLHSDSSDDEEIPYDRRSKSSFMAFTIYPTIEVTICFPGIQKYKLMSMLDTGANLNLARWHCFPQGNWEPSRQGINFGGNFRMSHWQCWAPILFPNNTIHDLLFVHTELPDHDLAIGATSMRTWEPYTFAAKEVILQGNSFPRLINYDCSSTKCTTVPIPDSYQKQKKKDKSSWIGKKLEKVESELQQIQEEFAKEVMRKDLGLLKRDLWCSLPLKKDDSGKKLVPVFKANYFLMNREEQDQCAEEIKKLLQLGMIQESKSPFCCHAMYVPKMDENGNELKEKRLVVNYKPLNKILESNQHPLPSKDFIWSLIQGANLFSKFDLTKSFWQIKIMPEDRYKTAFSVPQGLYEWTVLPFGIKTAPSIFQGHMDRIFRPHFKIMVPYIDDILLFSKTPSEHLSALKVLKDTCLAHGLVINPDKCHFCQKEIIFLGIRLLPGHYPAIAQAWRNLNRLLRKDSPAWNQAHHDDIQRIKDTCATLPPLHLTGKGEKIVETDASEHCWGAVLKERDASGKEVPVRYASGTFQGAEQRYHSTHKEILAVVKAFEQFELFIHDQPFLVRSDLNNLQSFLNTSTKKKVARNRLLRWAEYLTQFDYKVEHLKGSKNEIRRRLRSDYICRKAALTGNQVFDFHAPYSEVGRWQDPHPEDLDWGCTHCDPTEYVSRPWGIHFNEVPSEGDTFYVPLIENGLLWCRTIFEAPQLEQLRENLPDPIRGHMHGQIFRLRFRSI